MNNGILRKKKKKGILKKCEKEVIGVLAISIISGFFFSSFFNIVVSVIYLAVGVIVG